MSTKVGTVIIDVKADTAKLVSGMDKAEKTVKKSIDSIKTAIVSMAAAYVGIQGVKAFSGMINDSLNAADATGKLAQQLGLTTDLLSEYQYAAGFAAIENGKLSGGISSLIRRLKNFQETGGGAGKKGFEALGISAEYARKNFLTTDDAFREVLKRLEEMPDGYKKTAAAQDIFSKSSSSIMRLTLSDLDKFSEEAKRIGISIPQSVYEMAAAYHDQMDQLDARMEGVGKTVAFSVIAPMNAASQTAVEMYDAMFGTPLEQMKNFEDVATTVIANVAYSVGFIVDAFNGVKLVIKGLEIVFYSLATVLGVALEPGRILINAIIDAYNYLAEEIGLSKLEFKLESSIPDNIQEVKKLTGEFSKLSQQLDKGRGTADEFVTNFKANLAQIKSEIDSSDSSAADKEKRRLAEQADREDKKQKQIEYYELQAKEIEANWKNLEIDKQRKKQAQGLLDLETAKLDRIYKSQASKEEIFYMELGDEIAQLGIDGATAEQQKHAYDVALKTYNEIKKQGSKAATATYNNGVSSISGNSTTIVGDGYKKVGRGFVEGSLEEQLEQLQTFLATGAGRKVSRDFDSISMASTGRARVARASQASLAVMEANKIRTEIEAQKREEERLELLVEYNDKTVSLISSLSGLETSFKSLSDSLGTDYVVSARETLFGGTDSALSFAEARRNADEAWIAFQSDNNQELLDDYNSRMNELLGTLNGFNDKNKYDSISEQEFAKHLALNQIKSYQDAQLDTQEEVDLQLGVLEQMKVILADGQVTREEALLIANLSNNILTNGVLEVANPDVLKATKDGLITSAEIQTLASQGVITEEQSRVLNEGIRNSLLGTISVDDPNVKSILGGTLSTNDTQAIGWLTAVNNATKDGVVSVEELLGLTTTTNSYVSGINDKANITNSTLEGQDAAIAATANNTGLIGSYTVDNVYEARYQDGQYVNEIVSQTYTPIGTPEVGFYNGGFTGDLEGAYLHKNEYVLNANTSSMLGLNDSSSTGVFSNIVSELKEMKGLLNRQLQTQNDALLLKIS